MHTDETMGHGSLIRIHSIATMAVDLQQHISECVNLRDIIMLDQCEETEPG